MPRGIGRTALCERPSTKEPRSDKYGENRGGPRGAMDTHLGSINECLSGNTTANSLLVSKFSFYAKIPLVGFGGCLQILNIHQDSGTCAEKTGELKNWRIW